MGNFDAFLLMPRGTRDEEFHTAVFELLSEWGATVPVPLVDSVQLVSTPESEVGREIVALYDGEPTCPLMRAYMTDHIVAPGSVREVATMNTGRPGDILVDTAADILIVGAGPGGLAAAVYGASGCRGI